MRNKTSFVRYSPKFITRKWYCCKTKSQSETSKWKHNPTDKEIKSIFFTHFILFYFFIHLFCCSRLLKRGKSNEKTAFAFEYIRFYSNPSRLFRCRYLASLNPARSRRHRHICCVVGGGGGGCCIKDSVEMLFFHHQFYYFLQIYFSFRLLFSNFTCC